jgi:hypothetical protein
VSEGFAVWASDVSYGKAIVQRMRSRFALGERYFHEEHGGLVERATLMVKDCPPAGE